MLKKILLLTLFFLPFTLMAKYYSGEIVYDDGTSETLEILFPISNGNPNLKVKRDGKRASIKKELLKYILLELNDGEDKYVFLAGREYSKKNKKRKKVFTLVENVTDNGFVVGKLGLSFEINRIKGSDKLGVFVTYVEVYHNYSISKVNEETFFPIYSLSFGIGIRKYYQRMIEKYQDTLFSDCLDLAEKVDYDKMMEGRGPYAIIEAYSECLNQSSN